VKTRRDRSWGASKDEVPEPLERRERRERARRARRDAARRVRRLRAFRSVAIGIVAAPAILVGALFVGRSGESGVSFSGDLRAGGRLESLSLPPLAGRGRIDYAGFSDRPLLLNFFASWCPNCIAEMPGFERVHRQLGDRIGFLGVSQSDARSASIDLAQQTGITYPAGIDATGRFSNAWGTFGMPTTVFIRPGGTIAYVYAGGLDESTLRSLIGKYLGVTV
jgi:thiol-disulfide isomerase/thioredoxin